MGLTGTSNNCQRQNRGKLEQIIPRIISLVSFTPQHHFASRRLKTFDGFDLDLQFKSLNQNHQN